MVRRPLLLPRRPRGDFRWGPFVLCVGLDPFENFGVAFLQLFFQRLGVNAGKFEELLVDGTGVMIFAVFAGERCAALVEAARQDRVATQPDPRAARWLFRQIRSV